MNVLTARARKINQDGTLGNFIDGFPFKSWDDVYIAWGMSGKNSANLTKVDPSTLGYETGKLDKNGEMIYGGMKVRFAGKIREVYFEDCRWKIAVELHRGNRLEGDLWTCKPDGLEIVKDGE